MFFSYMLNTVNYLKEITINLTKETFYYENYTLGRKNPHKYMTTGPPFLNLKFQKLYDPHPQIIFQSY